MADYDLPDDLIQLRRAFLDVEARLADLRGSEDREAWQSAFQESQRLALELHRHPYWAGVDNRHGAWMALQRAASAEPSATS